MVIYPAVDLLEGRLVRLRQGDPTRSTSYGDDAVGAARRWVEEGARWLHVVDLDGALRGAPRHLEAVGRICRAVPTPVQFGGGLRTLDDLAAAFAAGVARAIVGTAALDPTFLADALARYGDRIALALDARDGVVVVRGWQEAGSITVAEAVQRFAKAGVARFIYTNVARDGMLAGPDLDGLRAVRAACGLPVILSGGVTTARDVTAAAAAGAEGVVIGRALYDGWLRLADAQHAAQAHSHAG